MDGEQIDHGEVLGSSMVPILSREIFAVLEYESMRNMKSLGKTPRIFIDDWSLIGDPTTVMVFTDLAKVTSGFDLGFEEAMASDLDGLR